MAAVSLPPIRLVALDLDGTTLRSDKRIAARTCTVVKQLQRKGVQLALCTGRPLRNALAYAAQLGLEEHAILYNGAVSYDYTREVFLHHDLMERVVVQQVITRMRQVFPQLVGSIERLDGWFWDSARYLHQPPQQEPTGVGDIAEFVNHQVIKVLFKDYQGVYSMEVMAKVLSDMPVYVTWSSSSLLEVMAAEVNKARATQLWAAQLGIPAAQVLAFGDQDNDKELLQWAGTGIAVANAAPHIKTLADGVTLSNDQDGVALVLEQLLQEHYA